MWSMPCFTFTWDLENMAVKTKISWFFLLYTTVLVCIVFFNAAHIWEIVMGTGKQKNLLSNIKTETKLQIAHRSINFSVLPSELIVNQSYNINKPMFIFIRPLWAKMHYRCQWYRAKGIHSIKSGNTCRLFVKCEYFKFSCLYSTWLLHFMVLIHLKYKVKRRH